MDAIEQVRNYILNCPRKSITDKTARAKALEALIIISEEHKSILDRACAEDNIIKRICILLAIDKEPL